uniref:Uncharacterized protein n=1 Tax=Ornithorhynchus anatinus TaxID=9258 RepID=A0A6I8PNY5_ORNAN
YFFPWPILADRTGPHRPRGGAEHRSAVYSSTVSTNRLDTAQMAMIRYTFTSTSAARWPPPDAPDARTPDARDAALPSCPLSTSDTLTVAVARSAGSPWSRTTTSSVCRGPSASSRARVVLISPVYSPMRKGLRPAPPPASRSSYDSHAL